MTRRRRNKKHTRKGDGNASATAPDAEILSTNIEVAQSPDSLFTCTICLDGVELPVVTQCGHLYCWPCLYQWLEPGMKPQERLAIVQQVDDEDGDDDDDRPSPTSRRACPACKAPCSVTTVVPIYVGGKDENHDSNEPPQSGTSSHSMPASSGGRRQAAKLPPRPTRVITELAMELTLAPTLPNQPIRSPTISTGNTFPIPRSTVSLSDISGASSMNRRSSTEFDQHEAVNASSTRLNPNAPSFGFSPEFLDFQTSATTWHRPDSPYPGAIGSSQAFGEMPQSYAREMSYPSTHTFHPSAQPLSDLSGATPPTTPNLFSPTTMDGVAFDAGAFGADYVANRHQPSAFHGGGIATAASTPPLPPNVGGGASSSWEYHEDFPNRMTTMPAPNSAVFGSMMSSTHPTSDPAIRDPFWGAPHASTALEDHNSMHSADYWQAWYSGYTLAAQRVSNRYGGAIEAWRLGYLHGLGWPRRFSGGVEDDGIIVRVPSDGPMS